MHYLDFRKALWFNNNFSYDIVVVFPDGLSWFVFDCLIHFCVFYSFFIVAISHRFVIKANVGDDILDFCGSLIVLVSLDPLCWIESVMVSFMVSMSSSSCSVSNRFLISSWNSSFFDNIYAVSIRGVLLAIDFSFSPQRPVLYCS